MILDDPSPRSRLHYHDDGTDLSAILAPSVEAEGPLSLSAHLVLDVMHFVCSVQSVQTTFKCYGVISDDTVCRAKCNRICFMLMHVRSRLEC